MTVSAIKPIIHQQQIDQKEGPLASIFDELIGIILSNKNLYSKPFLTIRGSVEVRLPIHALLVVSKKWNTVMKQLIVSLLNCNKIRCSDLPDVSPSVFPKRALQVFFEQPKRANCIRRLDFGNMDRINGDVLGSIVKRCMNLEALLLSMCTFDLNNLCDLSNLQRLNISCVTPLNVAVLGTLPSLKNVRLNNCAEGPYWTHLNLSTSIQKLDVHSRSIQHMENLPACLNNLTLSRINLIEDDPFQFLTSLRHLAYFPVEENFHSLKNLSALESLEITTNEFPEDYLEDVKQIKRLKLIHTDLMPSLKSFRHLTQLFLVNVYQFDLSGLNNLIELKMVKCSYSSETFVGLNNLKKLTLEMGKDENRISLKQLTNLEELTIKSSRLTGIEAFSLINLKKLKIMSKALRFITLPLDLAKTAEITISKNAKKIVRRDFQKGVKFEERYF